MRPVSERVDEIRADDALEGEDGPSRCERVEELVDEIGWGVVLDHLLEILRRPDRGSRDWDTAAQVIWGATLDRRPMPVDRVVAHAHPCHRWPPASEENNLAWSIIAKLEGVGYLSAYDPLADAGVLGELARIERLGGSG